VISQEALTGLLVEKGIFTKKWDVGANTTYLWKQIILGKSTT
jgi:hypothetical protein